VISASIDRLIAYGRETGLLPAGEEIYARNLLLDLLGEENYTPSPAAETGELPALLAELTDHAVGKGLLSDSAESRDRFDARLMNCLTPRPDQVRRMFREAYSQSPEQATGWFYRFCQDSNYIRRDRIARDLKWVYSCEYGDLDITINRSKPEKDPRDIAAARSAAGGYPACALCAENEGYAGRPGHPGRANHRLIPLELAGEPWLFQYSPYVYYNEHCIVLSREHTPMVTDRRTFRRLLDFVGKFPHYFLGANAGLPVVGGSILSHDHFQGGRYSFAMERAPVEEPFAVSGFADVRCGVVRWMMPALRLRGSDPERVCALAGHILDRWRAYSCPELGILAETAGEPHNAITPIARFRAGAYELDLVLRNNRTTPEHPLGLFHPHEALHHIKKENIGLIEVMGLAVLPARLSEELTALEERILRKLPLRDDPRTALHADWAEEFLARYDNVSAQTLPEIVRREVGRAFQQVLTDAAVFKPKARDREKLREFLGSL